MHPLISKLRNLSYSRTRTPRRTILASKMLSVLKSKTFRYYLFLTGFSSTYLYLLNESKKSDIEVLRIGAAGSLTVLLGESSFYFIDAINTRSKIISTENIGMR